MELVEFKAFVANVMDEFYATEVDLLRYRTGNDNGSVAIHELNISFHIGCIIKDKLKQYKKLKDYDVDVEYNKYENNIKRLDGKIIRPDIIVHKRRTNKNNFAWIEVKKLGDDVAIEEDRDRLRKVTDLNGVFHYQYGVLIIIGKNLETCKIEYHTNGGYAQ